MNNKGAHKDYCENYDGTLAGLAADIGAMTHGARADLFGALADYVKRQHDSDLSRGRIKYAGKLKEISVLLGQIKKLEDDAWDICKSKTTVVSKPKKQDFDDADILSQIDYAGIIYRKDSDAIDRVDEEDGDYTIKDFITANDAANTNIAMVEISASCHNTYNDNDTVYYFITAEFCDLMPHSVRSGAQPKILTVKPGSVLFIPKKSDHTFIGSFKAVVITLVQGKER